MGTCWDLIATATTGGENHLSASSNWCFSEKQALEVLFILLLFIIGYI